MSILQWWLRSSRKSPEHYSVARSYLRESVLRRRTAGYSDWRVPLPRYAEKPRKLAAHRDICQRVAWCARDSVRERRGPRRGGGLVYEIGSGVGSQYVFSRSEYRARMAV